MPGVIAVSDFVRETREDINSPTTSGFVNRIPQCKETVHKLEEVRPDFIFYEYFFWKIYVRNAYLSLTDQETVVKLEELIFISFRIFVK